jgi:excisionase family DNA binding protein
MVVVDEFNVAEAASRLGVSRVQIGRLIANGDLDATRFGRAWAIDRASLFRYAALHPPSGRPLNASNAWLRLQCARPGSISDLEQLAVICRRRARRLSAWMPPATHPSLLHDALVVPSGVVAAAALGAPVDERPPFQIYVRHHDWPTISAKYRADEKHFEPNVVVRIAPDDAPVFGDSGVDRVVAGVDLVSEREHRIAGELLAVSA